MKKVDLETGKVSPLLLRRGWTSAHASWSVKATAVPLDETEAFEANASSEGRGFHAGSL